LTEKFPEIRNLALFHDISTQSFETLTRAAYVQTYPPSTELITEGDAPDFLYVVQAGAVELFANWAHRETSMWTVWPQSTFILAATVKNRPYLMSGRTLCKSRVVLLPSADVRNVFETDGAFAKAIVTELANGYRGAIKNSKNLKLRSSLERLANYLLTCYRQCDKAPRFLLEAQKSRLASNLGMTPENLSRALNGLKKYGVAVDGQSVELTDIKALTDFAQPSLLIDDDTPFF